MPTPVSVLICTRNRVSHLRDTLRSIDQLSIPSHLDPELIIVDNGSTDATSALLADPPVECLPVRSVVEPRAGAARARNTALSKAEGKILLWLDDDIRVPSGWLYSMTRPISEGDADAVAGRVTIAPHLERSWMRPFHRTALASTEAIDEEDPKNIISANMAFARHVLEDVPGFDPELGPGRLGTLEDTLFSWQLREAGYQLTMSSKGEVEHHFDEKRLERKAFRRAATARGQSLSYIRYHWLHDSQEDWTHRTNSYQVWRTPSVVLAKRQIDSAIERWRHWMKTRAAPIDRREFWATMNVWSLRQFLIEKKRPRNYAEKGLEKLRGARRKSK